MLTFVLLVFGGNKKATAILTVGSYAKDLCTEEDNYHWNGYARFKEKTSIDVLCPSEEALAFSSMTNPTLLLHYVFAKRWKVDNAYLSTGDVDSPKELQSRMRDNIFSSRLARPFGARAIY